MNLFPEYTLTDCKTALSLFSAAFGGEHDVEFIYKAGIKDCRVVDHDPDKMKQLNWYGFKKTVGDVFAFINLACEIGWKYDVIVSDQWTHQDKAVWDQYENLKSRANKYLVIGVCQKSIDDGLVLPEGELMKRSDYQGGVYWHITKI